MATPSRKNYLQTFLTLLFIIRGVEKMILKEDAYYLIRDKDGELGIYQYGGKYRYKEDVVEYFSGIGNECPVFLSDYKVIRELNLEELSKGFIINSGL